mmetsp:Transcript_36307/g.89445  ORF Transcript_36307/g.89445 Transcript_36307/m.89445 type:complete len:99 (+) Transcript_36307:433-729(+)
MPCCPWCLGAEKAFPSVSTSNVSSTCITLLLSHCCYRNAAIATLLAMLPSPFTLEVASAAAAQALGGAGGGRGAFGFGFAFLFRNHLTMSDPTMAIWV